MSSLNQIPPNFLRLGSTQNQGNDNKNNIENNEPITISRDRSLNNNNNVESKPPSSLGERVGLQQQEEIMPFEDLEESTASSADDIESELSAQKIPPQQMPTLALPPQKIVTQPTTSPTSLSLHQQRTENAKINNKKNPPLQLTQSETDSYKVSESRTLSHNQRELERKIDTKPTLKNNKEGQGSLQLDPDSAVSQQPPPSPLPPSNHPSNSRVSFHSRADESKQEMTPFPYSQHSANAEVSHHSRADESKQEMTPFPYSQHSANTGVSQKEERQKNTHPNQEGTKDGIYKDCVYKDGVYVVDYDEDDSVNQALDLGEQEEQNNDQSIAANDSPTTQQSQNKEEEKQKKETL